MKQFMILVLLFLFAIGLNGQRSLVPLHISDIVTKINNHRRFQFNNDYLDLILASKRQEFTTSFNQIGSNVSTECLSQINNLIDALENRENWALRVIDSFGKIPSGILNGDMTWLGEFSSCRNKSFESFNFTGNYVLLAKPIDPMEIFRPQSSVYIKYGFCAPINCSKHDIANLINSLVDRLDLNATNTFRINTTYIQFQQDKPLDSSAVSTLTLIGSVVVVVFLGTVYDIYKRYLNYVHCQEIMTHSAVLINSMIDNSTTDENGPAVNAVAEEPENIDYENLYFINLNHEPTFFRILVNFSLYTNTKKIFKVDFANQQLGCLHGIRVLSLCWVILGHSYAFGITFSDNITAVNGWLQRFSFMIVSNAFFSVDSFFFISGVLTYLLFVKHFEKANKKISLAFMFKYYLHRYWRLSPPYFICLLVSANLSAYFGKGPLYPPEGFEYEKCQNSWFWNLLYINNLVNPEKMCFGISWYLANDMQFHWIAPLVLIPLAFKKTLVASLIIIIILVINLTLIPVTLIFNQYPGIEKAQFGPLFSEFFNKFYILPWCRIGPFIVGIVIGHLILMNKKSTFKMPKKLDWLLWIISMTIIGLLVFGLYPDAMGENPLNKATHIVYQTLSRLCWSLSLSYFVYSCITQNGGIINKILSSHIWIPFSRLSYCAFLVHVMVIICFYVCQEHLFHIQDTIMIYFYVSNLLFSYFFGYLVSVFFEIPLIGLEKFVV